MSLIIPPKIIDNQLKSIDNSTSIITTNNKDIVIRKKKAYKKFLKLVKDNKFTTAVMVSKIIGVDNHTIGRWLETPKVNKAMEEEIEYHVNKVRRSKDWRSSAYIIDKLTERDTAPKNLIQVNTVIQEDKAKYNI